MVLISVFWGLEADNPTGYGRLKTDDSGALIAIIEEADASQDEKGITRVNAGVMAFSADVANHYLSAMR